LIKRFRCHRDTTDSIATDCNHGVLRRCHRGFELDNVICRMLPLAGATQHASAGVDAQRDRVRPFASSFSPSHIVTPGVAPSPRRRCRRSGGIHSCVP
jgi:hypothetical protein